MNGPSTQANRGEEVRERYWGAPLLGVLFIALAIAGFTIGGEPPDFDEGAQAAVDFYTDDKDSIEAGSLLGGLGAIVLLFFAGVVRSRLRETEGLRGTLSAIAFGGAIVLATGLAIDSTINFAAAEAADDLDPSGIHTLSALWQNDWIPFAVGALTFVLATSVSIVRFGVLAKWLGYLGILLAILLATPLGEFVFPVLGLWVIALSVMLALRDRKLAAGTPPAGGASPAAGAPTV